jgi:hypothetical protein
MKWYEWTPGAFTIKQRKFLHSDRLHPYSQTFNKPGKACQGQTLSSLGPLVSYEENEVLWKQPLDPDENKLHPFWINNLDIQTVPPTFPCLLVENHLADRQLAYRHLDNRRLSILGLWLIDKSLSIVWVSTKCFSAKCLSTRWHCAFCRQLISDLGPNSQPFTFFLTYEWAQ